MQTWGKTKECIKNTGNGNEGESDGENTTPRKGMKRRRGSEAIEYLEKKMSAEMEMRKEEMQLKKEQASVEKARQELLQQQLHLQQQQMQQVQTMMLAVIQNMNIPKQNE